LAGAQCRDDAETVRSHGLWAVSLSHQLALRGEKGGVIVYHGTLLLV